MTLVNDTVEPAGLVATYPDQFGLTDQSLTSDFDACAAAAPSTTEKTEKTAKVKMRAAPVKTARARGGRTHTESLRPGIRSEILRECPV